MLQGQNLEGIRDSTQGIGGPVVLRGPYMKKSRNPIKDSCSSPHKEEKGVRILYTTTLCEQ
jgi:hypothetical protein